MVEVAPDAQERPRENGDHSAVAEAGNHQPKVNGFEASNDDATRKKRTQNDVDPEAQQLVIDSLRSQVQDLFSQVSELNNKLVKSYDRVSDLEDDLHDASEATRSSSLRISQLESEREQHLSALNTGILVEKSQVTAELTRLMEKATEEAAQRGQAESARQAIEKDLDDLSATLFGQANTMVAEARLARHESEQKVQVAERNLKTAEEAVSAMQQQIQMLRIEKEEAERLVEASQEALDVTIGKGTNKPSKNPAQSLQLLSSHSPYQEFLLFVAHLRSVHSSSSQPPAISSLLPLPFLARLLTEDSEPTIRFDLAPSLNWLSRRSMLAAVHNGQLIIEPMSSIAFLQEVNPSGYTIGNVSCALCGTLIFSTPTSSSNATLSLPPVLTHSSSGSTSWSASLFKKPPTTSTATNVSTPSTPTSSRKASFDQVSPSQVYIFKLATPPTSMSSISIPSRPKTSSSSLSPSPLPTNTDNHALNTSNANPQQSSTIYPLCTNNWCLSRLRSTCSLWAFVRSGVVEKIWEEEVPILPTKAASPTAEKPPIPPRRRGLWGMASALGERAVSWGEGDKDKAKKLKAAEQISTPPALEPKSARRRLPPPLPPQGAPATTTTPIASTPAKTVVPPPLPKRSGVRQTSLSSTPASVEKPVGTTETSATGDLTKDPSVYSTEVPSASLAATPVSDAQPKVPSAPEIAPTPLEASTVSVPTPMTPSTPVDTTTTTEPKLPPRPPRRPMNPDSRPQTPPVSNASPTLPDTSTPPPLPRRAATRASRALADSDIPSRPSTPAKHINELNAGDVDRASKKQDPEQAALSVPAAVPLAEEGVKEEKLAGGSIVLSPSIEEDVFVDAESGSESERVGGVKAEKEMEGHEKVRSPQDHYEVEQKADKVERSNNVEEEPKVEEKDEKDDQKTNKVEETAENTKLTNGAEEKAETKLDEITEKAETSFVNVGAECDNKLIVSSLDVQATGKEHVGKEVDTNKESSDDDSSGNYVGDTTWEERTWKELIRLKEAMFWARIGGLKQSS
ncbi:hypothetical protein C0992_002817 [Termitomyces sp. T32_za158]|nr:hypothetical protein C0992_002817 [Termitomyces sp. T32_za158]